MAKHKSGELRCPATALIINATAWAVYEIDEKYFQNYHCNFSKKKKKRNYLDY